MSEKSKKRKVKLAKKSYVLVAPFVTSKKAYKAGDKIMLTDEGRAYLKSIHKI